MLKLFVLVCLHSFKLQDEGNDENNHDNIQNLQEETNMRK